MHSPPPVVSALVRLPVHLLARLHVQYLPHRRGLHPAMLRSLILRAAISTALLLAPAGRQRWELRK